MNMILKTDSPAILKAVKTASIGVIAAVMMSACSGGDGTASSSVGKSAFEVEGDHAIGAPDAPITVVEYASVTCGACANWHSAVWPQFQKDYVDTGKVRFIYREFPTPPVNLAMRGFLIANCAAEDKFFANISLQYDRQQTIFKSSNVAAEYEALAKASGLNSEEYEACVSNEDEFNRLTKVIEDGQDAGVASTPTFFINGEKKSVFKIEDFDREFAAFVDVPQREDAGSDDKAE